MSLSPAFLDDLRAAVGDDHVITEPERLATYDCDGLTGWRAQPAAHKRLKAGTDAQTLDTQSTAISTSNKPRTNSSSKKIGWARLASAMRCTTAGGV